MFNPAYQFRKRRRIISKGAGGGEMVGLKRLLTPRTEVTVKGPKVKKHIYPNTVSAKDF